MDWDNLRYFLELARAGTLVGAARRLAVDHTTVARRLQALEKQVGEIEALEQENASDYQKLMELGVQKEELNEKLLEKYGEWEELSDE